MVLRRPYSFLIKHFRLIHIIITLLFGYLVYLNIDVYKYLNSVTEDTTLRYNAGIYINYQIYIFMFIALLLCFFVFWLLKYKDKPRRIYIFTMIGYVIIGVFMLVLFSYMSGFSNNLVDQKTIRLYRDVLLITLFFQYYVVLFMLIRGLGFDIKKFNFGRDVQELNLNESDSEEVEIDTRIDTTNIKRMVRKQSREFGYFYKEFKVFIIIILIVLLSIGGYNLYKYISEKYKVYGENVWVGTTTGIMVKGGYFSTDDGNYVILSLDVGKTGVKEKLNLGNLVLIMDNHKYTVDKNVCSKFNNLGTCYKQQYITDKATNYLVAYSVDNINTENVYLIYTESYDKSYKIKLDLKTAQ